MITGQVLIWMTYVANDQSTVLMYLPKNVEKKQTSNQQWGLAYYLYCSQTKENFYYSATVLI